MSSEAPPACQSCRDSSANNATIEASDTVLQDTAMKLCKEQYLKVSHCMKMNKGSISDCRIEWDAFRTCHVAAKKSN